MKTYGKMDHRWLTLFLLITVISQGQGSSMFGWMWGQHSDDTTVLVADGVPLVSIPYEAMTEDEKFLQEAAKFTEIQVSSPLETCQHKVVMKIRTSCSDMTEEELAKLSVNLLNCQSAVEGRKMFPCTQEMSLKQCTTDMDADMWNAYHLMSNRARAVCYSARSTQFRALSELTVNKLMQTAHTQIKTLSSLKDSQDRLEEKTVEALSSLSDGNKALLEQQQHLKDAQTTAHNLVTSNLRELTNERALIRTGHAQLATMAEDIKNKLEEASQNLVQQAAERGENHREVLEDLMNIQEQAQHIWDKIESSTNRIFEQHVEAIEQYEQTLQKLVQINETIQFIWNVTNTMRAEVDQKLNWITDYIGDTGEQMQRMYRTALHVAYLLTAMIVAAFLQAPLLTRATIMGIVPLNLATYLKHGAEACLDFTSITALILLITAMHFMMVGVQYLFGPKVPRKLQEATDVIDKNGHANGVPHTYTSSPLPKPPPLTSLRSDLVQKARGLYNFVYYQFNRCARTCRALMTSLASWSRRSLDQREELSCSYMPAKKSRDDLVYNYEREFPSMSEDNTDFENSRFDVLAGQHDVVRGFARAHDSESVASYSRQSTVPRRFGRDSSIDDLDKLVDADDLRRRITRTHDAQSVAAYSRQSSVARSVTPRSTPRSCSALTRSGNKCRAFARHGQNFCNKHTHGNSVMGD